MTNSKLKDKVTLVCEEIDYQNIFRNNFQNIFKIFFIFFKIVFIFRLLPLSAFSQLLLLKLMPNQRLRLMPTMVLMDMDSAHMPTMVMVMV